MNNRNNNSNRNNRNNNRQVALVVPRNRVMPMQPARNRNNRQAVNQANGRGQIVDVQINNPTPRRRRNRVTQRQVQNNLNVMGWDIPVNDQATLKQSYLQQFQTSFYPSNGVFRGASNGLEVTALGSTHGAIDITGTSANQYITFAFLPLMFSTTMISYLQSSAAGNPISLGSTIAGPFAATPGSTVGSSARCISAEFNIVPTGAGVNQAGSGVFAYVGDMDNVAWTTLSASAMNYSLAMSLSPSTGMSVHWVPSPGDENFYSLTTNVKPQSGIVGNFIAATGSNYRIEYLICYEYVVTPAFNTFIEKRKSTTHPDASYYISKTAFDFYNPLMFDTYTNFLTRRNQAQVVEGAYSPGKGGMVGALNVRAAVNPGDLQIASGGNVLHDDFEEEKDDPLNRIFRPPFPEARSNEVQKLAANKQALESFNRGSNFFNLGSGREDQQQDSLTKGQQFYSDHPRTSTFLSEAAQALGAPIGTNNVIESQVAANTAGELAGTLAAQLIQNAANQGVLRDDFDTTPPGLTKGGDL